MTDAILSQSAADADDSRLIFPAGTTGTGLDQLIQLIVNDVELLRRVPTSEIIEGAKAADVMNGLIVDAIRATGAANDGWVSVSDLRDMSEWIRADEARYEAFVAAHGNDEGDVETGFHLVQGDGAATRLFELNAINTVADGMYHLGFAITGSRVANEDGNANAQLSDVSEWVNDLLSEDLADGSLVNPDIASHAEGNTGTGLDRLVEIIASDEQLNARLATTEIASGARAADQMNQLIIAGIRATSAANDGSISVADLRAISQWIRADEARYAAFLAAHGNDEGDVETGFHIVQGDGANSQLFGQNAVNTVADGLYHIGFAVRSSRFENEDGNLNASLSTVSDWLNDLLAQDLEAGTLVVDAPVIGGAETTPVQVAAVDPYGEPEAPSADAFGQAVQSVALPEPLLSSEGGTFTGAVSDVIDFGRDDSLRLENGTFAMAFSATTVSGLQALIARDTRGRDEGGEFSFWLHNGRLRISFDGADKSLWREVPGVTIVEETHYHIAFSFGEEGLKVHVNGELALAEPEYLENLTANDENLLVGGSRRWRNDEHDPASVFNGEISDVEIYATALGAAQIAEVASISLADTATDAALDLDLRNEALAPGLAQLHHGSDLMTEIAQDYGINMHGHIMRDLARDEGSLGDDALIGGAGDDGINGLAGDDVVFGLDGNDILQGGAGQDSLVGGIGNDILDGGFGADTLWGGEGDDLLIARSDAGAPAPAYDADRDEGDANGVALAGPENLVSEDVLIGGAGADTFYIQTLIDGQEEFLREHTQNDGTIRWHGVAGENANIHDHWVEAISREGFADVIADFSREEGDRIVIEGHTTQIRYVTYGDANNDGVFDHSIISLYSDQGNGGGAHNQDELGTIHVYGDLIAEEDILYDAGPAYGVVATIDGLAEALNPPVSDADIAQPSAPQTVQGVAGRVVDAGLSPVLSFSEAVRFTAIRDAQMEVGHRDALALEAGTIAMAFNVDADASYARGHHTLFSKDGGGADEAGQVRAYISGGVLKVEIEHEGGRTYLTSGDYAIEPGVEYSMAFSFGDQGVQLYLNGSLVDMRADVVIDWLENTEDLVVGASGEGRTESNPTWTWNHFEGEISDLVITEGQITREQAYILHGGPADLPEMGTPGAAALLADMRPDVVAGDGLSGEIFDVSYSFGSIVDLQTRLTNGLEVTHRFDATQVNFANQNGTLGAFVDDAGTLTSGDGTGDMHQVAIRLTGYMYIPEGEHEFTVRSDDGYQLSIGGEAFSAHQGPRGYRGTSESAEFDGGLYEVEILYYENGGDQGLTLEIDGAVVGAEMFFASPESFEASIAANGAIQTVEPAPETGPALVTDAQPAVYEGSGLTATVYDAASGWSRVTDLMAQISAGDIVATHAGTVSAIDFGHANQRSTIANFFGEGGDVAAIGDAGSAITSDMETVGVHLEGFVYIPAGMHRVTVRSDDGYLLMIGGEELSSHHSPRPTQATHATETFEGGLYPIELFYFENSGNESLRLEIDGETVGAENFFASVADFEAALDAHGVMPEGGLAPIDPAPKGTTGTSLDTIVDLIVNDPGLQGRIPEAEIWEGARAADGMAHLIVDGIRATGVARDGTLSGADIAAESEWIRADEARYEHFVELHGNDEDGVETGYHLVQNDGAVARLFARNAVNTVIDGYSHIGFEVVGDRLANEDGNRNARLEEVAYWLGDILEDDLASGALVTQESGSPYVAGVTGTGLDAIVELINSDPGLARRVSNEDLAEAASAANTINTMIVEAIDTYQLGADGVITASDVYAINAYIQSDPARYEAFLQAHGNDEGDSETGFHTVQNDGAVGRLYALDGINTVADGIYHIGFDIQGGRLRNEDGNANASVTDVAHWLTALLEDDISGNVPATSISPAYPVGTTGTGLDQMVSIIAADPGLQQRIAHADIVEGARAADGMSNMIIDGIRATGVANDGSLTASDMSDVSQWIRADEDRYAEFVALHGNDEDGVETGFHLVQNDGSFTQMFGRNAINTVIDGISHLGFEIVDNRVANEDGNKNARLEEIAYWLSEFLEDDLATGRLASETASADVVGTTGTGLDDLLTLLNTDAGLERNVSNDDIREGAAAADGINTMIVEAIRNLGLADDGAITASDVYDMNTYIRDTHLDTFIELHGNDEDGVETGYHTVQNDGAETRLFAENAANTVMDGIYHVGFEIENGRFRNEDGDANASVEQVAEWLDQVLADDMAALRSDGASQATQAYVASATAGQELGAYANMDILPEISQTGDEGGQAPETGFADDLA